MSGSALPLLFLGNGADVDFVRAVLDHVEDGIVACDAAGVLRYSNRATRRMHGLPEAPLSAAQWPAQHELFAPDGVTPLRSDEVPLWRALHEGEVRDVEILIVPRAGTPRRLVCSGRAVFGADGEKLGAVVSMHDVTDARALAEERERFQVARLATVLSSVEEGVVAADAAGNVVEWNGAALAMHGFESAEQARQHLSEFPRTFELRTPEGEVLPIEAWPMSRALRGEAVARMELLVRRLDAGWEKSLAYSGAPVRGARGEIVLALLTIHDVTARRRDEELLARSQRQMELVVQGANAGVWYCPLPFDRLVWDAKVKEHFHLPPDAEVTIDTFYERLHPDDRERTRRAIDESITKREPYHLEYRTVSPDGTHTKWIQALGRGFYDASGAPIRFDGITVDVTEKKRIELEREHSERRFREMADAAPAMLWITEPDGYCSFLSRGWYEYTGQTIEEGLGYGWANAAHPDDQAFAAAAFRDASERRAHYEVDFRLRRADGVYRWVIDAGQPRFGPDGEFLGFVGSVIDVHERKEAEARLRESEARLRLGIAIAELGTCDIDLTTDAVIVNDTGREIYGWAPDERLTFTGVQKQFHPDDAAAVMERVDAAVRPEGPDEFDVEQRILRTDGATRWIRVRGRALFEGTGATRRAVRIVGTYLDVTERKAAERRLRDSEERFRQLANAMPQLAWMARPDGWIFWYNERWYEYTGTTPQQMEGWGWQSVHDPEVLPQVVEGWSASIASGRPFEMTFPLRGADGTFRPFLTRVAPLRDASGNIALWFGTNTDVSDQERLLAERQALLASEKAARERAEEESRLKDEFLATLSHELRTPLNAILGWTQLMSAQVLDGDRARQGLQVIERNARVQAQLIEDLLDMSRIISGKIRLDVQPVSVVDVVEAACETVSPAAEAKGLRFLKVLDPLAPPVSGDANRLQQVVWNLLHNAVKFTPHGGCVEVRLERVGSQLEISVHDTGEGIPSEFLPHVFDRFRQADGSTTRRYGGLGLGLSIVKQLVELHGGSVRTRSEGAGRGATFVVVLPLAPLRDELDPVVPQRHLHRTAPVPTREGLDEVPAITGVRVLVVDDDADARDLVRRLLETCGAKVDVAASAAAALQLVERAPPDVLVSDIGMPAADGYELIRRVRQRSDAEGGRVPAVALTAFARGDDRRRAIAAGYQQHLAKPVDASELITVVASLAGVLGRPR